MRTFVAALAILSSAAAVASDGEIEWTQISFCDGSGYCVQIKETLDHRLGSVAISHDGDNIDVPDLTSVTGHPDLRAVRLISVELKNGYGNRLETPLDGDKPRVLLIRIGPDHRVSGFEVIEREDDV